MSVSYELSGGLEQLARMGKRHLAGRAVKLLDYGLWFPALPVGIEWRFIWLDRDPVEQAKSQVKLMALLMPGLADEAGTAALVESLRTDRQRLLSWYEQRGEVLVTSFELILADSAAEATRLAQFIPGLDAEAAAAIPTERSAACAADLSHELTAVRESETFA